MNGYELRNDIQNHPGLKEKSVPYLFFSTAGTKEAVIEAYNNSAQGFFIKPSNYEEFRESVKVIIDYWKVSLSPTSILLLP